MQIILASQSPRRRELVQLLGYPFRVLVSGVDESSISDPDPAKNVIATAQLKATAVTHSLPHQLEEQILILAADTTVAFNGRMLNKPAHKDEAVQMLAELRGQTHQVYTGFTLIDSFSGKNKRDVTISNVTMRNYSDEEIKAYVASGDPLDKAGAYSIQHPIFRPVSALNGCFLGVMGLSICHILHHLRELQVPEQIDLSALEQAHAQYGCSYFEKL